MVEIDGERLLTGLRTLRTFGAAGTGVMRQTFTDADMDARRWLRDQMESTGLEATIDGVGNVWGRSPNPGPALIIGSHSDTQPEGGWLDGAMGVMYAIEIARAVADDPATAGLAIDVVAWSDEEGTYTSCLGSMSFVGELTAVEFAHENADGESVEAALERVGLADVPQVHLEPERHVGYLEAHIEQGPHLEEAGLRIGVVSSIVGIRSMRVNVVGQQNHAGTTPMHRRRDAAAAMFELAVRIRERLGVVASPVSVWTIGNAGIEPGGESIIAGHAWLSLQFRDPIESVLAHMEAEVMAAAAEMSADGVVEVTASRQRDPIVPTDMAPELRDHIRTAAESRVPGEWVEMPSAAGHDPMVVSHHLPCGMLFIPSIGGISHDFAEDSTDVDIVTGCQVLADAAVAILDEESGVSG